MWACKCRRELRAGGARVSERANARTGAGTAEDPSCKAARAFLVRLGAPKSPSVMSSGEHSDTSEVVAFQETRSTSRSPVGCLALMESRTGKQRASCGVQFEMSRDQWGWSLRQAATYGCQHSGNWAPPRPLKVAKAVAPPLKDEKAQARALYQDGRGWAVRKRAIHMA